MPLQRATCGQRSVFALVAVPVQAHLSFELTGNQVGGEGIQNVLSEVSEWFESFSHWVWVLTAQSLDPLHPDPKLLHRRSHNILVVAFDADQTSLTSVGIPTLIITTDPDGPTSERIVDENVLDLAVRRASEASVPLVLELLASARMAARRGDARRSLLDAGTASEGALSKVLGLPPDHQLTLGALVTQAASQGISIPSDTQDSLVKPRNDAAHRGQAMTGTSVARAIEIAEELVALTEPDLVRSSSLRAVHRPQRHDLFFILPPKQPSPED